MVFHSRRSVLRNSAVCVSVLAAGCSSEKQTEGPSDDDQRNQSSSRDEILPPGTPPLEPRGEWPLPRFDAGNTASNPDGIGMQTGTEYWRLTVNAGGPATIADGTLYNTANIRDQDSTALTYRDPATAAIQTSIQVDQSITLPIVANNRVFVTSRNYLMCFDAKTGDQQWQRFANRKIVSRPMVHDGIALINTTTAIQAYDTASGDRLWKYDITQNSNSIPTVGENKVFVSSTEGLHAIEFRSGDEAYTVSGEMDSGATPVYHDQTIYVLNSDTELVAATASDGTVRWRIPVWSAANPPVVTPDVVYTCTADETVALDSADGSVISSSPAKVRQPVGLVGDVLYGIGDTKENLGDLFALDVANNLRQLWSLSTSGVTLEDDGSPAHINHVTPIDGAVYIWARDGFHGVGPRTD